MSSSTSGTALQTITLAPGETLTLPPGATVLGSTSASSITSSCGALPSDITLGCYKITWSVTDNGNNQTEAWDNYSRINYFTKFAVNGVVYTFPSNESIYGDNGDGTGATNIATVIASLLPPGLLTNISFINTSNADYKVKGIQFTTFSFLVPTIYIEAPAGGVDGVSDVRFYPIPC